MSQRRTSPRFWALLLLVHACVALAYRGNGGEMMMARGHIAARQLPGIPPGTTTTPPATPTDTDTTTSTSDTTTTTTTTSDTDTSTTSTTTTTSDTSTTTTSTTSTPPTTTPPPTTTSDTQQTSEILQTTTDEAGSTVIVTEFTTNTPTDTAPANTQTNKTRPSDSGGISTSTIVGLSVAGGIALLGVIGFFIWKFTRKRSAEFDDEPIKWPELNQHNQNENYAPPLNRGASTNGGLDSASEVDLPAHSASSQYSHSIAADSSANLYASGADPYAVPPMPTLNPNQPYRDDPNAYTPAGYYDPYRGPVPQVFNDTASMDSHAQSPVVYAGEAIPMSTLAAHQGGVVPMAGRMSPGPQMAYDMDRTGTPMGRQSPGPAAAYGAPYGGRASPGPAQAYGGQSMGYGGRHSPGPGPAYGGGF